MNKLLPLNVLLLLTIPISVYAECTCEQSETSSDRNKTESIKLKLVAIASILASGAIGVSIPISGKVIPALCPKNDVFFVIKAFAAGVILATGFVHVLPEASESLASPCLKENPWGRFPFTGLVAMLSAIGTLMVDTFATSYHTRSHLRKAQSEEGVEKAQPEKDIENDLGHVHVHKHTSHGHARDLVGPNSPDLMRNRVVSQVLELGILVHSVIIGVSLGASLSPKTIKPLVEALTFHQLFEGMGLGGCISQANFKPGTIATMAIFFSLTTPIGIMIGFGISNIYNENSPTALIVEGIFNSASAGILIYMALVDLLAADFMNPRVQNNLKLQIGANISLLLGAGCMSLLAIWA